MRLKLHTKGAAVGVALMNKGKPLAALATPDAKLLLQELVEAGTPKSIKLALKVAKLLMSRGESVEGMAVGQDAFPFVWPLLKEDKAADIERDQTTIISMNTRGGSIPGPAVPEHGAALFGERGKAVRAPQGGVWIDTTGLTPYLLTAQGNLRHYFINAVELLRDGDTAHPGDPIAQVADDPVLWFIYDPSDNSWVDPVQWAKELGAVELTLSAPPAPVSAGGGAGVAVAIGLLALTGGALWYAYKGR